MYNYAASGTETGILPVAVNFLGGEDLTESKSFGRHLFKGGSIPVVSPFWFALLSAL